MSVLGNQQAAKMPPIPQALLAITILAGFYATFVGMTPPNPNKADAAPPSGDFAARLKLTAGPLPNLTMLPQAILAAHQALLA